MCLCVLLKPNCLSLKIKENNNDCSQLLNFLPWYWSKGLAMTFRHPFGLLLLFLLEIKRWHEAKTSCHMHNIHWTPNIFTDCKPPNYWLKGVPITCALNPPNLPYGGRRYFLGGMTDWLFWSPWNQLFSGSSWPLISCYLFLRSTLSPQPLTPLEPNGGAWVGPEILNEGGYLTSLTPKCDKFLKSLENTRQQM